MGKASAAIIIVLTVALSAITYVGLVAPAVAPRTVTVYRPTTQSLYWTVTTTTTVASSLPVEVLFSPRGGCEQHLMRWIDAANSSIHVLIYSFTLDEVGGALVSAMDRGVDVKVLFEKNQISQYSEYDVLKAAGVPVRNDTSSGLMHNKVAIIDGEVVLTGSYNWSSSAETRNNENLLVIRDSVIAQQYEAEFQEIWSEGA